MKPVFLVIALCTLAWCCSKGPENGTPAGGQVELTYWPAPNNQEIELADSIVGRWNRIHPEVRVRMEPIPVSQSTEEVLLAAIAGRTTPDVCSNIWPGALSEFTRAGGLIPLDTFPDFDSAATARTPGELLQTFRSDDGHCYQLPWKTNPIMMFYNTGILAKSGITTIPRTYSEYFADAALVTRDTNGDGRTDVWMGEHDIRPIWWERWFDFYCFYIAGSGGKTLFDGNNVGFDNVYAQQSFGFFQECYAKQYYPRTFYQAGDLFALGKKASLIAGPWEVAQLSKFSPDLPYTVAALPVPDGHTGPVYTYGDFKNIAVFSTTRHPREAWEFAKFLVTAEHDLLLLEIADQIPIREDLLTNPLFAAYFRRKPLMVKFAEQAPFTRGMDPVPDLKEIFDAISQEYEACAIYNRKSPQDAIHDAAARTRMIIDWNR